MADCRADAAFLDAPYNVPIAAVVGRGRTKYREFAMASGEMSSSEYIGFLDATLGAAASVSRDGADDGCFHSSRHPPAASCHLAMAVDHHCFRLRICHRQFRHCKPRSTLPGESSTHGQSV